MLGSVVDLNDDIVARVNRVERRLADFMAANAQQTFLERERADRHGLALAKLFARTDAEREQLDQHAGDIADLVARFDAHMILVEQADAQVATDADADGQDGALESAGDELSREDGEGVVADLYWRAEAQDKALGVQDAAIATLGLQVADMRKQLISHDHCTLLCPRLADVGQTSTPTSHGCPRPR